MVLRKKSFIEACVRNMEQEVAMMSLKEQMAELLGMDTSEMPDFGEEERVLPEITVITNKSLLDGAGSILLLFSTKKTGTKVWFVFIVLPSSRHEVLIVIAHRRSPRGNLLSENGKGSQRNTG